MKLKIIDGGVIVAYEYVLDSVMETVSCQG